MSDFRVYDSARIREEFKHFRKCETSANDEMFTMFRYIFLLRTSSGEFNLVQALFLLSMCD